MCTIKTAETARIFLTRDHSAVIRRFAGTPRSALKGAHSGTAPVIDSGGLAGHCNQPMGKQSVRLASIELCIGSAECPALPPHPAPGPRRIVIGAIVKTLTIQALQPKTSRVVGILLSD